MSGGRADRQPARHTRELTAGIQTLPPLTQDVTGDQDDGSCPDAPPRASPPHGRGAFLSDIKTTSQKSQGGQGWSGIMMKRDPEQNDSKITSKHSRKQGHCAKRKMPSAVFPAPLSDAAAVSSQPHPHFRLPSKTDAQTEHK